MRYKPIAFAAALSLGSAGWAMAQNTAPNPTTSNPQTSPTGAPYAGTSANPDVNGNRAGNAGLERGAYRGWPVATHLNDGQAVEGDTVVRRLNFGSLVPLAVERRAQTDRHRMRRPAGDRRSLRYS